MEAVKTLQSMQYVSLATFCQAGIPVVFLVPGDLQLILKQ